MSTPVVFLRWFPYQRFIGSFQFGLLNVIVRGNYLPSQGKYIINSTRLIIYNANSNCKYEDDLHSLEMGHSEHKWKYFFSLLPIGLVKYYVFEYQIFFHGFSLRYNIEQCETLTPCVTFAKLMPDLPSGGFLWEWNKFSMEVAIKTQMLFSCEPRWKYKLSQLYKSSI